MKESILAQISILKQMSTRDLQQKYEELFNGKRAPSNNKVYLWKKIAYRIQELDYGTISEEAQGRAKQLMEEYDPINNKTLRPKRAPDEPPKRRPTLRDRRLPIPGTVITKEYKNTAIEVKILEKGIEYNGRI